MSSNFLPSVRTQHKDNYKPFLVYSCQDPTLLAPWSQTSTSRTLREILMALFKWQLKLSQWKSHCRVLFKEVSDWSKCHLPQQRKGRQWDVPCRWLWWPQKRLCWTGLVYCHCHLITYDSLRRQSPSVLLSSVFKCLSREQKVGKSILQKMGKNTDSQGNQGWLGKGRCQGSPRLVICRRSLCLLPARQVT